MANFADGRKSPEQLFRVREDERLPRQRRTQKLREISRTPSPSTCGDNRTPKLFTTPTFATKTSIAVEPLSFGTSQWQQPLEEVRTPRGHGPPTNALPLVTIQAQQQQLEQQFYSDRSAGQMKETPTQMPTNMSGYPVWHESERGLRSLRRGWQTPDPSPSDDAAGLPGYRMGLSVVSGRAVAADNAEDSDELATPRNRFALAEALQFSRTPSHSPVGRPHNHMPAPLSHGTALEKATVSLSSLLQLNNSPTVVGQTQITLELAKELPPRVPVSRTTASGSETCCPPPPPRFKGANVSRTGNKSGRAAAASTQPPVGFIVGSVVSLGSVGHPTTCKPPCKYNMKRRGCKDGDQCDRCHLCEWIRSNKTIAKAPKAQCCSEEMVAEC